MSSELLESFRHSAWANRQVLDCLGKLTPEQLEASLPTAQGTPLVTMKHLIAAESYYISLLRGARLEWDWDETRQESAAELQAYADDLAVAWEALLGDPLDGERWLETRTTRVKASVVVAQLLHHANVHREQVSAVLTSIGVQAPDVSAWAYGRASGGSVPK